MPGHRGLETATMLVEAGMRGGKDAGSAFRYEVTWTDEGVLTAKEVFDRTGLALPPEGKEIVEVYRKVMDRN